MKKIAIIITLGLMATYLLFTPGCKKDKDTGKTSVLELKNIANNFSWEPDLDVDENGNAFIVASQIVKASDEGDPDLNNYRIGLWKSGFNELPKTIDIIGDPRICVAGSNAFITGLAKTGAESQLGLAVGKVIGNRFVFQQMKYPLTGRDSGVSVDKPEMAVSPDGSKIFIAYVGFTSDTSNVNRIFLIKSTDGGNTFTPPIEIAGSNDISMFINEMEYKQGKLSIKTVKTPVLLESDPIVYPLPIPHQLLISTNDGISWIPSTPFANITYNSESNQKNYDHLGSTTIGSDGVFYAVANDNSNSNSPSIVMKKTTDGVSWSTVHIFTPNAGSTKLQHPMMAIENRNIALAWCDNSISGRSNIFVKYSKDNGVTWTNPIRVSENLGKPFQNNNGFGGFYGDYGRIRIKNNIIHLTWAESFQESRQSNKDASTFYKRVEIK